MLKACSNLVGGEIRSGDNLDRLEWTAQAFLRIAKAQSEATICRRFVGGSAKNRALLSNPGNRCTVCNSCRAAYTLAIAHLVDLASGDVVQLVRTLPSNRTPFFSYL